MRSGADALDAYSETVAAFPADVVARTGRANLLAQMKLFDEAEQAYRETLVDFPHSRVCMNSMAHLYLSTNRFDEALSFLPEEARTDDEWIGLHIRAMVLMRQNKLGEAERILELGVETLPFQKARYFRTGLAGLRIRQTPQAAISLLEQEPQRNVLEQVLLVHAYGANGEVEKAQRSAEDLRARADFAQAPEHDLFEEVVNTFIRKLPQKLLSWIYEMYAFFMSQNALATSSLAA